MKRTLLVAAVALSAASMRADYSVDFSRIRHWAGEGENQAALVVQFLDDYDRCGYVWGYRWPAGTVATGEDMLRAIAAANDDIVALVQFTGGMGYTLNGIGYSENNCVLDYLHYDYESASSDPFISFDFNNNNELMGQFNSPGEAAAYLCEEAIKDAAVTHIIEHPLNQKVFGYPAYDYDWWQPDFTLPDMRWNSGWYAGYWSYWIGRDGKNVSEYSYSGLGMSSMQLTDGDINAWKFMPLDGPINPDDYVIGTASSKAPWGEYADYLHFASTGVDILPASSIDSEETSSDIVFYDLSGRRMEAAEESQLMPGIYVAVSGERRWKIMVGRN